MTAIHLKAITALIMLLSCGYYNTEAKFLTMRPLSARQVYQLLHQSGRSDAVPQGRIITQGLAAMTGFALGLTKGLGGALLFDIITANVTAADLAAAEAAENGGSTTNRLTTQEVCFNSRSARSLADAEAVAEAYSRESNRNKEKRKVRPSAVGRIVEPKRRNKRRRKSSKKGRRKSSSRLKLAKYNSDNGARGDGETAGERNGEIDNAATGTRATTVTGTTPTTVETGTGTAENDGQDILTASTSTTTSGKGGAINCVVIQKPAVR